MLTEILKITIRSSYLSINAIPNFKNIKALLRCLQYGFYSFTKSCGTMINNNKLLDLVNISSGIIVHAKCLFCKDQVDSANGNRLREGKCLRVLKM